ncbi:folylpolyglutamate synthase/dihydrofolate synthase family protein [uncultured Desulfosarcina sp.]|uniref:bifunctional folylpolyglutamate synthase/dihydrofolate synthase n=1 Tax=uncultured Desulfosarcina sp. TaxID=218289 RepID=UPI0029C99F07|nr:folylpolyglutamate synthase/dihydrofolate synthase family protein [uncultured Desulfosarcina sp.]
MPATAYTECLDAMFRMRRFGIILGLSTITNILDGLGNPQQTFSAIHIAGTNGKGSIASALATILQIAGYRVGLYTSPHLVRFNERICIDGTPISDDAVVASWEAVKAVHHGDREPTFFEFSTAMAFYEFARRHVDYAVIETGMGGRMDATNVITPTVSIITNISLEHKNYLGNTIAAISGEKAGIIKPGIPVVTGVTQKSARAVIEKTAAGQSAPLFMKGRDFHVRRTADDRFSYFGMDHRWAGMRTGLMGNHQLDNASLTLAACELIMRGHARLSKDHIQSGLAQNRWPGRLEVVSQKPYVILDGAHNLMAARRLGRYLQDALAGRRITMVAGILEDKPYESILKDLVAPCSRLIITRAKIDRSLPPETLEAAARPLIDDIQIIADVGDAVRHAIATSRPEDAVCVAGSLYVVGEAKAALEKSGGALFQI